MKCQRGDLSFIFNGNAVPSESFVVLDNEQKVYQRIHHEVCETVLMHDREFWRLPFAPYSLQCSLHHNGTCQSTVGTVRHGCATIIGTWMNDSFFFFLITLHLGVRDGDRGRSGHPDEQRRVLSNPLHQVHHLRQGTDGLALQRRQNGGHSVVTVTFQTPKSVPTLPWKPLSHQHLQELLFPLYLPG